MELADGRVILLDVQAITIFIHQRAKKLRVEPVLMNPAVNRVLLEFAGIKGLIAGELKKLTEAELQEAARMERRPRVDAWIRKETGISRLKIRLPSDYVNLGEEAKSKDTIPVSPISF